MEVKYDYFFIRLEFLFKGQEAEMSIDACPELGHFFISRDIGFSSVAQMLKSSILAIEGLNVARRKGRPVLSKPAESREHEMLKN